MLITLMSLTSFGQQISVPKTSDHLGYLEHLPEDYETSGKLYPTIIFLHGNGQRGDGSISSLAKVADYCIPKNINNGSKMCFINPITQIQECFIVLSPQISGNFWFVGTPAKTSTYVTPFVKWALKNYRIDPDRVYLTGWSQGGEGSWNAAAYPDNEPNIYAAIGPVAYGMYTNYNEGKTVAQKMIPVWAFSGTSDTQNSTYTREQPIKGMRENGGAPIWTLYQGGTHGSTMANAYREDHSLHNPNLYEWFLAQGTPTVPTPTRKLIVKTEVDENGKIIFTSEDGKEYF